MSTALTVAAQQYKALADEMAEAVVRDTEYMSKNGGAYELRVRELRKQACSQLLCMLSWVPTNACLVLWLLC